MCCSFCLLFHFRLVPTMLKQSIISIPPKLQVQQFSKLLQRSLTIILISLCLRVYNIHEQRALAIAEVVHIWLQNFTNQRKLLRTHAIQLAPFSCTVNFNPRFFASRINSEVCATLLALVDLLMGSNTMEILGNII